MNDDICAVISLNFTRVFWVICFKDIIICDDAKALFYSDKNRDDPQNLQTAASLWTLANISHHKLMVRPEHVRP